MSDLLELSGYRRKGEFTSHLPPLHSDRSIGNATSRHSVQIPSNVNHQRRRSTPFHRIRHITSNDEWKFYENSFQVELELELGPGWMPMKSPHVGPKARTSSCGAGVGGSKLQASRKSRPIEREQACRQKMATCRSDAHGSCEDNMIASMGGRELDEKIGAFISTFNPFEGCPKHCTQIVMRALREGGASEKYPRRSSGKRNLCRISGS